MANESVKHTTDSNFEKDVLKNPRPALVDFWATWCSPCRALAPIIDQIATQYAGKVDVFKVDIDSNPETPARFGVRGIPTAILFKNGAVVDQVVGSVPKSKFDDILAKIL